VLLYRSSCGRCQATAAELAEVAQAWQLQRRDIRVALIDADSNPNPNPWSRPGLVEGTLEHPDLYHTQPMVVLLVNGRVAAVQEGTAIDWESPLYR
jgi:hypothetical protein